MLTVLKNCAYLVTQDDERRILRDVDVLIVDGKIQEIGSELRGDDVIDCSQKIVMPGLVNCHTHIGMQKLKGVCDDEQLMDWLGRVVPKEKELSSQDFREGADLAIREMLESGTTTFAEFYYPIEEIRDSCVEHGIRSVLFAGVQDNTGRGYSFEQLETLMQPSDLIHWGVAAHSVYWCTKEQLDAVDTFAKKKGVLKAMHIAETRKERFDIQEQKKMLPVEFLDSIGWLDHNTLLIHAIWITKEEIKLLAKDHVHAVHCPVSNMKLASGGVMPLPEMIAAGVNVGLGTDSVASNNSLDMFEEMKVTGLLHKHHRWDATCAPLQKIMDMATRDGAKALGLLDKIGSLEVGKEADIVTLNIDSARMQPINNVLSTIIYSATGNLISDVLVRGDVKVREGTWRL